MKESINIVDVVSSYIDLKKYGSGFKAVCPFHDDKNPSLTVSRSKNYYHCFSCGAGGDIFTFVQEIEGISFSEAIESIAERFGFQLEYEDTSSPNYTKEALPTLEKINSWFVDNLFQNREAYLYLQKRGLTNETIKKFQIGYVPSSYEVLSFLQENKISFQDAEEVGVVARDEVSNNYYSRFHERVTFPIFSSSGKVIGFGGRTLSNHPAKYINSPTTQLFNKSKTLYGYNFAKKSIFKERRVHIVEGYLDVIMLQQSGFENSVAPLGTALTKEHLFLLKSDDLKINLAFDGDKAGIEAARRALDITMPLGIETTVTLFDGGVDPADLVANGEITRLRETLNNPQDAIKFYIGRVLSQYNLENPYDKKRAVAESNQLLSKLPTILRDEYSKYLSSKLSVGTAQIRYGDRRIETREREHNKKEFFGHSELAILRAIFDNRELLDVARKELSENDFLNYKELYIDILNGNFESNGLKKLSMIECNTLNRKEFEIEVINHKLKRLSKEWESILKNKGMNFSERTSKLRDIQHSLNFLKKRKASLEKETI